jgi:hypothetical protein
MSDCAIADMLLLLAMSIEKGSQGKGCNPRGLLLFLLDGKGHSAASIALPRGTLAPRLTHRQLGCRYQHSCQ